MTEKKHRRSVYIALLVSQVNCASFDKKILTKLVLYGNLTKVAEDSRCVSVS